MNVLITGHSGFVGSNFISKTPEYNCIGCDLLIKKISEIEFSGIDSVVHLAALVHQMKGAPEEMYFKINRDLAYEVAHKAKEQGVRQFILLSTAKVYGESTSNDISWNEDSECNPTDPYGKSKLEAERLISKLEDENFKVAIIRSPLVYGAGVKANMYNLVKLVDRFPILPLKGIENKRSMVYINNLVDLLKEVIKKRASGIFVAGDRYPLSTTTLVTYISQSLKKKRLLFKVPNLLLLIAKSIKPNLIDRLYGSLVLDNKNTNNRLNFTPPYTSEEGIRDMVKWFKNMK